jgi:Flp pilus assembly pilin Flp
MGQMRRILDHVLARPRCEDGQALIEYALIIALISLLAIGGLSLISDQIGPFFSEVGSQIHF